MTSHRTPPPRVRIAAPSLPAEQRGGDDRRDDRDERKNKHRRDKDEIPSVVPPRCSVMTPRITHVITTGIRRTHEKQPRIGMIARSAVTPIRAQLIRTRFL
jgi:hypothetical protein